MHCKRWCYTCQALALVEESQGQGSVELAGQSEHVLVKVASGAGVLLGFSDYTDRMVETPGQGIILEEATLLES
jgi:hypothetical protein